MMLLATWPTLGGSVVVEPAGGIAVPLGRDAESAGAGVSLGVALASEGDRTSYGFVLARHELRPCPESYALPPGWGTVKSIAAHTTIWTLSIGLRHALLHSGSLRCDGGVEVGRYHRTSTLDLTVATTGAPASIARRFGDRAFGTGIELRTTLGVGSSEVGVRAAYRRSLAELSVDAPLELASVHLVWAFRVRGTRDGGSP